MSNEASGAAPRPKRSFRGVILWGTAVVLVVLLAVYAFGGVISAPAPTLTGTTSTSYNVDASSVIAAAVQGDPAGYNATSFGVLPATRSGEQSAAYALVSDSQSAGNITAIVFDTDGTAQAHFTTFYSHVEGLEGYSNVTTILGADKQYGRCYAYSEVADGIAVANGICTDGNVFLQVHLSSSESSDQVEADLSGLMAAMYQSV